MSFSGLTAPSRPKRVQPELHSGTQSRLQPSRPPSQILPDLIRLLLAALFAALMAALGVAGLTSTTASKWVALLVQPACLLLFPGYFVESLDPNVYSFSQHSVLWVSAAFYFSLALLYLFPKHPQA